MTSSTRAEAERLVPLIRDCQRGWRGNEYHDSGLDKLEASLAAAEERGRQRGLDEAANLVETHAVWPCLSPPVQPLSIKRTYRKYNKQPRHYYADAIRSLKQPRIEEQMSSFSFEAKSKLTGKKYKVWAFDDCFGSHRYGYAVQGLTTEDVLNEKQFYEQFETEEAP